MFLPVLKHPQSVFLPVLKHPQSMFLRSQTPSIYVPPCSQTPSVYVPPCSKTPSVCVPPLMRETKFHTHTESHAKLQFRTLRFYTADRKTKGSNLNGSRHCPNLICS
jgi:hypothetical protein